MTLNSRPVTKLSSKEMRLEEDDLWKELKLSSALHRLREGNQIYLIFISI